MPEKEEVRVRLAPSPTGFLHLGTARTALFNLIFARRYGGKFIIRIEDTDLERSEKKYEEEILNGLKWLGIESEEPATRQSERTDIYEKYLKKLLEEKKAYFCYCTKEELEAERQSFLSQGISPKYSGKCRDLDADGRKPQLIRLKVAEKEVSFKDLIRGKISFDSALFGDFAIAKDVKTPLYNFANVVDDFALKISHVIRGEDHISNTPKQILIQEALGFPSPHFAHLPLILSPDRSKMSKRYTETSLLSYKEAGYLPEALVNFLALLGWHPADDKEIMNFEEICHEFDIEKIQKSGAIFNQEKLDWLNYQYIKKMEEEELFKKIKEFIPQDWLIEPEKVKKIISIQKERIRILSDIKELGNFFFKLPDYEQSLLIWKEASKETIKKNLKESFNIIKSFPENFNERITAQAEEFGRGEVFWPLRVALSGLKNSPPPFDLIFVLGLKESAERIKLAIEKL